MSDKSNKTSSGGITIGAVIAIILSWVTNHSILWCVIHGFFGWLYIFYRLGGCGGAIPIE